MFYDYIYVWSVDKECIIIQLLSMVIFNWVLIIVDN